MKNVLSTSILALSLSLSLSLSSVVQAQNVNIDNRTGCYYILNLVGCDEECSNGPLDAPDNQVTQYSLSTVGMSSPTDVGVICICEHPGGTCEPLIVIDPCNGGITPVYTCTTVDCNGNTLYIDWWISTGGTDFEILLRI